MSFENFSDNEIIDFHLTPLQNTMWCVIWHPPSVLYWLWSKTSASEPLNILNPTLELSQKRFRWRPGVCILTGYLQVIVHVRVTFPWNVSLLKKHNKFLALCLWSFCCLWLKYSPAFSPSSCFFPSLGAINKSLSYRQSGPSFLTDLKLFENSQCALGLIYHAQTQYST